MKKAFFPALSIFLLLALSSFPLVAFSAGVDDASVEDLDSMIQAEKKNQEDLGKKIQRYNALDRQKWQQSKTLLGRLTGLRQESQTAQARMNRLQQENDRLQKSMGELSLRIVDTSKALSDLIVKLRGRVVDMYKFSVREELDILLASRSAHEALTTAYMLGRLARRDRSIINDLSLRAEALKQARKDLESSRAQVQRQTEEIRKERNEHDAKIRQTNSLLKEIQGDRQKARSAAQELARAQQAVGQKINSLNRAKRSRMEQQKKAPQLPAQAMKRPQPTGSLTPQPPSKNYTYLAKGTALEWPVRGPVAVPFGSRVHPVFKTKVFNSGIDIRAASGAPVRSAGPGEVLFRGWIRGFGQVVIVDHGSNLSTVYAHLASASVGEGDAVRTGSLIGTVGNSGTSSDYGLHFEVRRNGSAQNPLNFLKKI